MKRVFFSKVDSWLFWVLVGSAIFSTLVSTPLLFVPDVRMWLLFVVVVFSVVAFPVWLLRSTHYTVGGGELIIRSGPFRWRILLSEIISLTPTHNPLSSPALSLDRLEIKYGKRNAIMVSPLDKEDFIQELKRQGATLTPES